MDFENTDVHITSGLEPYYSLLLLRIPTQEKSSHYHKSG